MKTQSTVGSQLSGSCVAGAASLGSHGVETPQKSRVELEVEVNLPPPPGKPPPSPEKVSPTIQLKRTLEALQENHSEQLKISKYWKSKISDHRSRFFDSSPVSIATVRKKNKFESFTDSLQTKQSLIKTSSSCKNLQEVGYGSEVSMRKSLLERFLDDCISLNDSYRDEKAKQVENGVSKLETIIQNVSRLRGSFNKPKKCSTKSPHIKTPKKATQKLCFPSFETHLAETHLSETLAEGRLVRNVTQQVGASCSNYNNNITSSVNKLSYKSPRLKPSCEQMEVVVLSSDEEQTDHLETELIMHGQISEARH